MSGGGSGNRYMMMYMMQQQQQQQEQQERLWQEQQNQLREQTANQETERVRQVEQTGQRVGDSYNSALAEASRRLTDRGLDINSGYGQQILNGVRSQYDTARASSPEIVADASGLFRGTALDDVLNEVLGNARSNYNRELNSFAGSNFQNERIAGSADDQYIDSIIGNQYTDAEATLQRALDRGQINDAGFSRALSDLGLARNAGTATGNSMGDSVLQGYRDQLVDQVGGYRDQVNSYDLSGNLNTDSWRTGLDNRTNELLGSLQGDITNKIGDYQFFDVDTLLGKAGVNSGVMNNNTSMRPNAAGGAASMPGLGSVYEDESSRQQQSGGSF